MKRTFSDGTHELVLTASELLRRLCALIPRPRVHVTRYHGVFAPNARHRRRGHGPTSLAQVTAPDRCARTPGGALGRSRRAGARRRPPGGRRRSARLAPKASLPSLGGASSAGARGRCDPVQPMSRSASRHRVHHRPRSGHRHPRSPRPPPKTSIPGSCPSPARGSAPVRRLVRYRLHRSACRRPCLSFGPTPGAAAAVLLRGRTRLPDALAIFERAVSQLTRAAHPLAEPLAAQFKGPIRISRSTARTL